VSIAPQANSSRGVSIDFQNIEKRYGVRYALRGVSLRIDAGECVALVGANGSGKTTLLKIAALLVRPTAGRVTFSESDGAHPLEDPLAVKQRIGMVAHHILLYDELTAGENLELFAKLYGLDRPRERAAAALEPAGLLSRRNDPVRDFSRGMRQRLAIARALLPDPGLLLFDEPATGLDPAGQHWLGETLARIHDAGCTILMSTHGSSEVRAIVTRAVRLAAGCLAEDSAPSGDAQRMLAAAFAADAAEQGA
jgi:ABC-type multidrug transport system ATPase subunit